MNDPIPPSPVTTLSTTVSKPAQQPASGSAMAVLALIFSLIALGLSGYQYWQARDEKDGKVISPLMTAPSGSDLESRIKAQENALSVTNETLKKEIDDLKQAAIKAAEQKNNVPDMAGTAATMQIKMADWEKQDAELKEQVKSELQRKSRNIAALAVLERIGRKAQLGLTFQKDLGELEKLVDPTTETAHAYNLLKGFEKPLSSDTALLADLNGLTPEFLVREKMEKTDSMIDKIGIQLQKLVVIRKKSGQVSEETPLGKILDATQAAIASGNWPKATSLATELSEKGGQHLPKDFPTWHDRLRDRALADEAINTLQHAVLNDLQGTQPPVAKANDTSPQDEPAQ